MTDTQREMQKKEAGTPETGERTRACRIYAPQVDIIERKDDIVIIADMARSGRKIRRDNFG